MVNLLIKDAANGERGDHRFPFLRNFDVYAGHSWANGPASFAAGNNQESSSEDVNMSAAVLLWGAITESRGLRDMAIFMYAQQAEAVAQYWFDADHQVFPPGFDKPVVGIVWGAGGNYDTWWDRNPVYVHGINMLPMTGGSLYLGRSPGRVAQDYDALLKANRGEIRLWRDVVWMFLALKDPERAMALFDKDHYFEPEFGNSMAATYQWIAALGALGQVDTSVTADVPTHAVFKKGNLRTHVAFNPRPPTPTPTPTPRGDVMTVTFSDGVVLHVPPGRQVQVTTQTGPP
jgi:endoglucanase Acf2